jgi:hypothetical protein
MKQPGEIHGGIGIAEELRSRHPERIDRGEGGRHAGCRIRPYRPGKLRGSFCVDLKCDRRVGTSGDCCNLARI